MTQLPIGELWYCERCRLQHSTITVGRLTFVFHSASGIAKIVGVKPFRESHRHTS